MLKKKHTFTKKKQMQEDEVWVDKYAYTTAIHAAGQLGKWARCVRYLDEMDSNGVAKDVVTVSVAISACADKGQWAQVRCDPRLWKIYEPTEPRLVLYKFEFPTIRFVLNAKRNLVHKSATFAGGTLVVSFG